MLDALTHQVVKRYEAIPSIGCTLLPDLSQNDWKYAAKLSKDVLIFMQRIGGLSKPRSVRETKVTMTLVTERICSLCYGENPVRR
jgi:hypothetical protein